MENAIVLEELGELKGAYNCVKNALETAQKVGDEQIIEQVEKQFVVIKDMLKIK